VSVDRLWLLTVYCSLHFCVFLTFQVVARIITLHLPSSSLTLYQNGAYFNGIKIFNKLSSELKQLVNFLKKFKTTLRRYLVTHCFYSIEEFYNMD
jgi:hypothetical protein